MLWNDDKGMMSVLITISYSHKLCILTGGVWLYLEQCQSYLKKKWQLKVRAVLVQSNVGKLKSL